MSRSLSRLFLEEIADFEEFLQIRTVSGEKFAKPFFRNEFRNVLNRKIYPLNNPGDKFFY